MHAFPHTYSVSACTRLIKQTQRFLNVHTAVLNLFNVGQHLINAEHYRKFSEYFINKWNSVAA